MALRSVSMHLTPCFDKIVTMKDTRKRLNLADGQFGGQAKQGAGDPYECSVVARAKVLLSVAND